MSTPAPVSRARNRMIVASLTAALLAAIGYTNVYLPFYSDAALERRKMVEQRRLEEGVEDIRAHGGGSRGSMWSNMRAVRRSVDAASPPDSAASVGESKTAEER